MSSGSIVVVGSANVDRLAVTDGLPRPGETLSAHQYAEVVGGKGANQAVSAAALGGSVRFVGCVGDDPGGLMVLSQFERAGVDASGTDVIAGVPTGTALITVDSRGENTIVVHAGANALVGRDLVDRNREAIAEADVVLVQFEVGSEAVDRVAALTSGVLVVNPAPARELSLGVIRRADVLVPNRTELAVLAGIPVPRTIDDVAAGVRKLGVDATVVVTLGGDGALVVDAAGVTSVPAFATSVVDTTGAGDCFCGALAVGLAAGRTIVDAVRWACAAAALSTRSVGAQGGLPTFDEVRALAG